MNKRFFILISILVFSFILIAGGYLLADRFGYLPKRSVFYAQPISEEEKAQEVQPEISVEGKTQELSQSEVPISENQEEKVGTVGGNSVINDEQKKTVEEKKVEPEKTVEKNSEVGKIVDKFVSWGFQKSTGRKIDTIIVHSSYNSLGGDVFDPDKIIGIYKQYNVSAHYLIGRDGVIYRLVQEKDISWHAGVSKVPDGRTNVNDFSIGIEMINTMDGKYTSEQYEALNSLLGSLKKKYEIKYILGHDEIAPGRKTDPWGIEWSKVNR